MSINVTVSGNPVSIKRGKMITADPYTAKKEFDKRRLLRLEQVRQQSRELAEDVRNKVRREKKKQMGQIEKEGKEKLKNWQNRKLLELQNQYLDALDEIGMGHKEAENLADENEILKNQKLQSAELAKTLGKLAETKHQIQKNEENYRKAMPIQHKKLVRDIENTRAALVSSIKKKQCSKQANRSKPKADINITIPNDSDFSEASSSDSSKRLPSIQEEDHHESEGFCECSESSEENHKIASTEIADDPAVQLESINGDPPLKSYKETIEERRKLIKDFGNHHREVPLDTRISNRIKQRQTMVPKPDYCDLNNEPIPILETGNGLGVSQVNGKDPLEISSDECMCTRFHSSCPCQPKGGGTTKSIAVQTDPLGAYRKTCQCRRQNKFVKEDGDQKQLGTFQSEHIPQKSRFNTESVQTSNDRVLGPPKDIPTKPAVTLKDLEQPPNKTHSEQVKAGVSRVSRYDHRTRFRRDVPSTTHVEKISSDSVEVIPNVTSEAEWYEKMKQRDIDAQVRGRNALKKEKIQKDYEMLLKKLPILQRREHISQIGTDKPEYHMSEERLKERERERQNQLENAYSKAIPDLKPQIVTIPSRTHDILKNDEPFEILDGDDSRTLNLGKWDTDAKSKTMFSAEEVQEIIKAFTVQKPEDRKAKLKELLRSLKLQKEQLINEIRALPQDDSVDALIDDLTSFSDTDAKPHRQTRDKNRDKHDRKRRFDESDTSSTSAEAATHDKPRKSKSRHKEKHGRSPHKKLKRHPPRVLVLQNTSTQTTPKVSQEKTCVASAAESEQTSKLEPRDLLSKGIKICTKSHAPCDCLQGPQSSEEVCKIFIKLTDEKSPKVEVIRRTGNSSVADGESVKEKLKEDEMEQILKPPQHESIRKERRPKSPDKQVKLPKTVQTKSVATETETLRKSSSKGKSNLTQGRKSSGKNESWKDQLSKNSMSTSSTSYMSPPDFSKPNTTASSDAMKQSLYDLRKKPQQTNIDKSSSLKSSFQSTTSERTNTKLLAYVNRLLNMSKTSVDDLGVSSSDVQTPSQSVIEMESNNPLAGLHDVIRFINSRAADIAREMTDDVHVPPNSLENVTTVPHDADGPASTHGTKETLVSQYVEVADSCSKRIANLATMIEQLRQEKLQMLDLTKKKSESDFLLSPNFSDKDNSTRYFEFPPSRENHPKETNSTDSMDEEELNRRLLEIDMSLADKLKQFRRAKDETDNNLDQQQISTPPPEDERFLRRLQRLIEDGHSDDEPVKDRVSFVPLLLDIPKLPILEPAPDIPAVERRHPPPSKGLISAKKFNGNISLVPHELSTIVEADSQLSTRISPNNSKTEAVRPLSPTLEEHSSMKNDEKPVAADEKPITQSGDPQKSSSIDSSKSLNCSDATCSSLLTSSSSSSDLKSIEAMLKSIGMDWAIPTLHKTQEALALSSSSSSGDPKRSSRKSTSSTEISLRDFLRKQMISKISSSSLNKSDASPASFMRECSEISAINVNSSTEKAKQRTSTPVLSSKSTNKSKQDEQLFTGASDISSVKISSCEGSCTKSSEKRTFHSLAGDECVSVSNNDITNDELPK